MAAPTEIGNRAHARPLIISPTRTYDEFTQGMVIVVVVHGGPPTGKRYVVMTAHGLFEMDGHEHYFRGIITNPAGNQLNDGTTDFDFPAQQNWSHAGNVDFAMYHILDTTPIVPMHISRILTDLHLPNDNHHTAIAPFHALTAVGPPSAPITHQMIVDGTYHVFKYTQLSGWTAGELWGLTADGNYYINDVYGFQPLSRPGDCGGLWFVVDGTHARLLGYHYGTLQGANLPPNTEPGMPLVVPWEKVPHAVQQVLPGQNIVSVNIVASAVW